jgi:hypothetical protein
VDKRNVSATFFAQKLQFYTERLLFRYLNIYDNNTNGTFGNVVIDQQHKSFVNPGFFNLVSSTYNSLLNNEFASYIAEPTNLSNVQPLKNGKFITNVFCPDFTHATLDHGITEMVLPITYIIAAMATDQIAVTASTTKQWNCDGYEFGNVLYKKTKNIATSVNTSHIGFEFKKGKNNFTDVDRFDVLVLDAISKGAIEIVNDAERLQAMKDYLLTINNLQSETSVDKLVKAGGRELIKQEQDIINGLDDAKNSCTELGFKSGTKEFGNCVLKLAK